MSRDKSLDDMAVKYRRLQIQHTLDHYLLKASKYFISHIELKFLPGVHKLKTVIKIQD